MQQNKKEQNIKFEKTSNIFQNSSNNSKYNIFAFGFLDLTFIIEFNDKEISQIRGVNTFEEIIMII